MPSFFDGVDDKVFLEALVDVMEEFVTENFAAIMRKVHERLAGKITGIQSVHMSKENH